MTIVLGLLAVLCVGCVGILVWSLIAGALERARDERLLRDFEAERRRTSLAQMEEATRGVAALDAEALEGELRIKVVRSAALATVPPELAVVLNQLTPRLVACTKLVSAPALVGLPREVRARLASHGDAALFEKALSQTLSGEPPIVGSDRLVGASAIEWLVRGADVLGSTPLVLACCGEGDSGHVRWIEAGPFGDGRALAGLVADAFAVGRLQGVLLFWDGARLHDVNVLQHTIVGPDTPDWTLIDLPAAMQTCLGRTSRRVEIRAPRGEASTR